ncbi:MAG: helix-turn-helix domain-containing protein [Kiritimatiellia bacterium]
MSNCPKSPGQQLREAREEMGKSLSDMAKLTRIGSPQLKGLEEDRYDSIPAPMYVRGFIKLYAQNLGIRHEPLVEQYEKIRKGESLEKDPVMEPPRPVSEASFSPIPPVPASTPADPSIRKAPSVRLRDPVALIALLKNKVPRLDALPRPKWLEISWVRYAALGVFVLFVLLLGLRGCRGVDDENQEGVPEPGGALPEVADPLLNPPEPVYFQLPSSYQ